MTFTIDIEPAVFYCYATCCAILAMKIYVVMWCVAFRRFQKGVFSNPEDAVINGNLVLGKVKFDDQDVERARRAHLNDLEGILLFMILGFVYMTTGPSTTAAIRRFRIFTIARILHTFSYLGKAPQPTRLVLFYFGMFVLYTMTYRIVTTYGLSSF